MTEMTQELKYFKVLDISTGHITQKDAEKLNHRDTAIIYIYGYGFYVYVGYDLESFGDFINLIRKDGYSEAFINILTLANKAGIRQINFDRDGELYDHLPQFDW